MIRGPRRLPKLEAHVNAIAEINVLRTTLPPLGGKKPTNRFILLQKGLGEQAGGDVGHSVSSGFWNFSKMFAGLSRQDRFTGYFLIEMPSKSAG